MSFFHTLLSAAVASMLLAAGAQTSPTPNAHFEQAFSSLAAEVDANVALVDRYMNALITAGVRGAIGTGFHADNSRVHAVPSDIEALIAEGNGSWPMVQK